MRRVLPLCALAVALAGASGAALADDMDGWCAQVKKASSIVICSDAELREQASARNKLFDAARAKLSPEAYKALTDDQSRWIKAYTARCGVSLDDPPPPQPVPQSVIDCYRRESRARTIQVANWLSEPVPTAAPVPTAEQAFGPRPAPPPAEARNRATDQWMKCLIGEAEALADQHEPAETVAKAALGACGKYELAWGEVLHLDLDAREQIKRDAVIPKLLASVLAARKAQHAFHGRSAESSVDSLAAWMRCTTDATDRLAAQPEPAQTVVAGAFGLCVKEEMAHQAAGGLTDGAMEKVKAALTELMLARVMAVRAARATLPKENKETKPPIDYGRM
jgi:uncharacterized protein YecT (DUF1311 family)